MLLFLKKLNFFKKNIYLQSSKIAKFSIVYCFKIISIGLFGDLEMTSW